MTKQTAINIEVDEQKISFNIGIEDFNEYQNECLAGQSGLVNASHNFLMRTVTTETRTTLSEFLQTVPGAAIEICGAVIGKYKKPLKITVGK